ncbi:MAG: hypothetical protein IRZ31_09575 [Thermogemmatispora sp.]|uniref:DUF6585 family protein n=1 Tax=Thermogemmatispora sp. TaxID=1968838 RepID=UPI00260F2EF2|nr:DUF6585 family protein [Thermogemmatispora sp.]MBX5457139.1 hypothetical protein [Thermogemmatispora sp.]
MQQQCSLPQLVPPAILRRAEAKRLGDWLCGYRLPQKTWGCLVLLLPLLFIEALWLSSGFSIFALVTLGVTFLLLLMWVIWTVDTFYSRIDLFSHGFLWSSPFNQEAFRWEDITTIWRGTYRAPSDSHPEGVSDIDTIKVKHQNGRLFEISTLHKLNEHERARICDTIESYFVATHLPSLLERYQRGEVLNFDPLFLNHHGLSNKGDFLPWSQVETIVIRPEQIVIRREGRTSDWYRTWVPRQRNACLLKAVVEIVYKAAR